MNYLLSPQVFTIKEGISQDDLSNQITALKPISSKFSNSQFDISQNFFDLSNNITKYNSLSSIVNTDKYDAITNDGKLKINYDNNNPSPDIKDVLLNDLNDNLTQQNLLYIAASITISTLIIAALIISRK
jgi:hypothetical protein